MTDEAAGSTIAEWTAWLSRASESDMRKELIRIYTANDEDVEGDVACKIMSYDWAHLDAVEMGYPSLTEALEALEANHTDVEELREALERLADSLERDVTDGRSDYDQGVDYGTRSAARRMRALLTRISSLEKKGSST